MCDGVREADGEHEGVPAVVPGKQARLHANSTASRRPSTCCCIVCNTWPMYGVYHTCSCALSAISSHIRRALPRTAATWTGVATASAACSSCATTSRGGQNVLPATSHSQITACCLGWLAGSGRNDVLVNCLIYTAMPCIIGPQAALTDGHTRAHLVAAQPPLPWQPLAACAPGRYGWPEGLLPGLRCSAARLSRMQLQAALKSPCR
jgi:hypothetical protein